MGGLAVLILVFCFAIVVALFVHAVRADRSFSAHRWIVVVPLLILGLWLLEMLITH